VRAARADSRRYRDGEDEDAKKKNEGGNIR
jgi:hypothetical protein